MAILPNYNQPITSESKLTNKVWYNFFNLINAKLSTPTSWATTNRPTNIQAGFLGYNTTTGKFEGYDGANWVNLN